MARSENREFVARSSTGSTFASVDGLRSVSQTFGGAIVNSISTRTVRDLAVEIPGATRVFETLGIDYCCEGDRTLGDACNAAGLTVENVMTSLEQVNGSHAQFEEPNFLTATLAELIGHIVQKHHVFTKTELARLRALMDKVHDAHGQNHPEITELRDLFKALSDELGPHMMKEESALFPFTIQLEDAARNRSALPRPPFGTIANPVRMMMMEHEDAGALLRQMRSVTADYTIPPDACFSYQTLYQALDAFEKDLHQHIHLENNILFPRAVEMEAGVVS
jgi:regulator of cell morphogenesis and NO signaling